MTNHASADPAAVLWDMDGTLVDTEPYWIRAETELMNAHGLPWSEEQGLEFVGNELIVSARMMRDAGLDLPAEEIVETLMGNVITRSVSQCRSAPVPWSWPSSRPKASVSWCDVLPTPRRGSHRQRPMDSFAGLVSGDEVSAGKPDPEPYLRGAALLDLDPAECVALEDSKPGLASAEAAGTIAIGIPHFVDLEPRPGRILWDTLDGRGVADLRHLRAQQSA